MELEMLMLMSSSLSLGEPLVDDVVESLSAERGGREDGRLWKASEIRECLEKVKESDGLT